MDGLPSVAGGSSADAALVGLAQQTRSLDVRGPDAAAKQRMRARFAAFLEREPKRGPWALFFGWLGIGDRPQPSFAKFAAGAVLLVAAGSGGSLAAGTTPWAVAANVVDVTGNALANLNPNRSFGNAGPSPVDEESTPTPTPTPTPSPAPGQSIPGGQPPVQIDVPPEASQTAEGSQSDRPESPAATETPTAATALGTPADDVTPPAATETSTGTANETASPTPEGRTPGPEPTQTPVGIPGETATGTPTPPPPTATVIPASEQTVFPVLEAGAVTYSFDGQTITLVDVVPASGWSFVVETNTGDELVIKFDKVAANVVFTAKIEDGLVQTTVGDGEDD